MPVVGGPVGSNPFPVGSGYGMSWTPEQRVTPAYTATPLSSAFAGGLLDLLQAARLADLNTTRLAVENNRAFSEDTRKQLNALIVDLMSRGIIAPPP